MTEFQLGQNALDVCKVIIDHQPDISMIRLVAHEVDTNWRQCYQTTPEKLEYMLDGFEHRDQSENKNILGKNSVNYILINYIISEKIKFGQSLQKTELLMEKQNTSQ